MKKRIIILSVASILFLLASIGFFSITYGWFTHQRTITTHDIGVGDLLFVQSGSFIETTDPIVPGQELVLSPFTLTNQSTISSQIRMQITYSKVLIENEIKTNQMTIYRAQESDHIQVVMNENFVYQNDYFYYGSQENSVAPNSGVLSFITNLSYNGSFVGIDYTSEPIQIVITIQVKQSDHVVWTDLTSFDFETGYPI